MKILENYMPLSAGETITDSIEGNAYNLSSNIVARLLGFIMRIMAIILGSPSKITLVVTNKRIIKINIAKFLWFFDGTVSSASYPPRAVGSCGYQLSRSLVIFKSHYLSFYVPEGAILIKSRKGKDAVTSMLNSISGLAEKVSK